MGNVAGLSGKNERRGRYMKREHQQKRQQPRPLESEAWVLGRWGHVVVLFEESPSCFPQWLHHRQQAENLEKWSISGRQVRRTRRTWVSKILVKVKSSHSNKCYCKGEVELYMETIFKSCLMDLNFQQWSIMQIDVTNVCKSFLGI